MVQSRIAVGLGCILLVVMLLLAGGVAVRLATDKAWVARPMDGNRAEPTMPLTRASIALATVTLTATPSPIPTVGPDLVATEKTIPFPSASPTWTGTSSPEPSLTPTATPSPEPSPTRPVQHQWIAFETQRGELGDYEIYVMAPDGSDLTNLTNSWADDLAPAWSPDGRFIAFVSLRDTTSGRSGTDPGNLYVLPFDPATGKAVGEAVPLTRFPGAEGWPAWSPDGKKIAFHGDLDGNFDIWVVNRDGSGLVNLTRHAAEDRFPAWSPDGTQIAFASTRSGDYDVWVMGADGSNPVNLTRHPARDRYPIWSPEGQWLTFNTDRDGNQEIYQMKADGSRPTNISRTPKYHEGLADWSSDGQKLVLYSEQKRNKDIFVVDLKSGEWRNLTNHPASDEYCAWWP